MSARQEISSWRARARFMTCIRINHQNLPHTKYCFLGLEFGQKFGALRIQNGRIFNSDQELIAKVIDINQVDDFVYVSSVQSRFTLNSLEKLFHFREPCDMLVSQPVRMLDFDM